MRILFYSQSPEWNGSARALAAAARGMSERGHNVTVVCPPESALEQHLEFGAYEVVSLSTDAAVAARGRLRLRTRAARSLHPGGGRAHGDREQLIAAAAARLAERAAVLRRVRDGRALALGPRRALALRFAPTGLAVQLRGGQRNAPAGHARALSAGRRAARRECASAYDAVRPASRASIGAPGGTRVLVCVYDRSGRARAGNVLRVIALLAPRHPELRLALRRAPARTTRICACTPPRCASRGAVSFLGERDDYLSVLARGRSRVGRWPTATTRVYALLDLLALARAGAGRARDGGGAVRAGWHRGDSAAAAARRRTPPRRWRCLLGHDDRRAAMGGAGRARVSRDYSEQKMIDAFEAAAATASDRVALVSARRRVRRSRIARSTRCCARSRRCSARSRWRRGRRDSRGASGRSFYSPLGIRRRVAEKQIAAAFPESSSREVQRMARESYRHLGRVAGGDRAALAPGRAMGARARGRNRWARARRGSG